MWSFLRRRCRSKATPIPSGCHPRALLLALRTTASAARLQDIDDLEMTGQKGWRSLNRAPASVQQSLPADGFGVPDLDVVEEAVFAGAAELDLGFGGVGDSRGFEEGD